MQGRAKFNSLLYGLVLAALGAFSSVSLSAEKVSDLPQPTDYVSDFAHVLSPEAIARLDAVCAELDHSQANAKIAVVTVRSLDGDDAADYANQLETHWKMGDKNRGSNRYAMVFIAVDDHKYRIEVGYGLEGILNDAKVGDFGREMVPLLRANDYDGAVTGAVGEIAQVIAEDAKVTLADQPAAVQEPVQQRHSSGLGWIKLVIILIVILLYLFRVLGSWGLFGLWGMGLFGGGRGFGSGSGGGWGGGGGGGGGGFGGFGGGGGGFGGGGAGGSW